MFMTNPNILWWKDTLEKSENLVWRQDEVKDNVGNLTNPRFHINTFSRDWVEISYAPKRWWLITSIKINWKEVLYFNQETFYWDWNVRWWIPVMFPYAGPIEKKWESDFEKDFWENLKQHWFARNSEFDFEEIENWFVMTLKSDESTKEMYNFDFELQIIVKITDLWIQITKKVKNTWDKPMPIAPWLHPYFLIPHKEKPSIKISCWNQINNDYSFCNDWTVTMENIWDEVKVWDKVKLHFWKWYKKIWIWSANKEVDYICVEPVYWDEWVILEKPLVLKPWEEKEFIMIINK